MSMPDRLMPALFIPHGAGPCFFMDWPEDPHMWDKLASYLRNIPQSLPMSPRAILLVSAHWVEDEFSVSTQPKPPLIFDYYGFPASTYQLQYPAPGSPMLADRVSRLFAEAGLVIETDSERGLDHGAFIPLMLMYPQADIPVLQLSLKRGLDPGQHWLAGTALHSLRAEGVLVVGSGMSFHNMRGFTPEFRQASEQFDDWLATALSQPKADLRQRLLADWQQAPAAALTHPYPDHLLPLMVTAGAASEQPGRKTFSDVVMNVRISAFEFG